MTTVEAFSATRSLQALEILAFGPLTASQVALELQVHPRTVRRLLNRMVDDGWIVRRGGHKPTYSPTLRVVALAAQNAERSSLVRHGMESIRDLHASTGAHVHLVVPCYRSTLRLARAQEAHVVTAMRDLAPAHATAAGKVLLAYRPQWRDAVLSAPLTAVANGTIVDPERLHRHLGRVQQQGYAIEDEELLAGVRAVAAPVRASEADEPIAALAASSTSLSTAALQELGLMLVSVAQQLAEAVRAEQ